MSDGFVARQSFIRSTMECGRRAWHDHQLGENLAAGYSESRAALGTAFHETMAEIFRTLRREDEREISTEEAMVICREVQAKSSTILPTQEQEELRMLVLRFASEYKWPIDRLLAVEERITMPIVCPDGETRYLTGQPDALFASGSDTATIIDAKTGWSRHLRSPRAQQPEAADDVVVGKEYLSPQGHTQLTIYGMLVMHAYPACNRAMLFEIYPRTGDKRQAFLGRDELEHVHAEAGAWLQRLDLGLQAGPDDEVWSPRPGSHCARACPVAKSCVIPAEQRGRGAAEDQEAADALFRSLIVLDAQRDQTRDALKAFFTETGLPARHAGKEARWDGGKGGGAFRIVDAEEPHA